MDQVQQYLRLNPSNVRLLISLKNPHLCNLSAFGAKYGRPK